MKDELREGDQILVKVLAIEGSRIKLSRKAVLREQREKLGLPPVADAAPAEVAAKAHAKEAAMAVVAVRATAIVMVTGTEDVAAASRPQPLSRNLRQPRCPMKKISMKMTRTSRRMSPTSTALTTFSR